MQQSPALSVLVQPRSSPPPEDRGCTKTPKQKVQKKQQKSTTKSTNQVKSTLKQISCHCCFYLTHIFEVSRFEVLIPRFFWACFSKPPDLHVTGVGRSAFIIFNSNVDDCFEYLLLVKLLSNISICHIFSLNHTLKGTAKAVGLFYLPCWFFFLPKKSS